MTDTIIGLFCLAYFALAIPASMGVFAQGATGLAVFVVVSAALPLIALFTVTHATMSAAARRP
jgi:hypothetical protein